MLYFIAGMVIFFGAHIYSAVRIRGEHDIKNRIGYGPYMGLYSLVSLIGFVLIVYGFGALKGAGILYTPPNWARHVNILLMIPALILLVASQLPAGQIKRVTRHPMLVAVKLWAIGHLLANGELNSVLLFGSFLAYAVFDRIRVKRRGDMGPDLDVRVAGKMDVVSIIIGVGVWTALAFWLHPVLFGVSVIA